MFGFIGLFAMGCSDTQPPTGSLPDTDVTASSPDLSPSPGQPLHADQVPEQARQRIRIEEVKERLTPHSVSAPGHVALDLSHVAKVSSRIPGQVDKVMVQLGDRVKKISRSRLSKVCAWMN